MSLGWNMQNLILVKCLVKFRDTEWERILWPTETTATIVHPYALVLCYPTVSSTTKTHGAIYRGQLAYKPERLWNVEGNQNTRKKCTRSQDEHANFTQTATETRLNLSLGL